MHQIKDLKTNKQNQQHRVSVSTFHSTLFVRVLESTNLRIFKVKNYPYTALVLSATLSVPNCYDDAIHPSLISTIFRKGYYYVNPLLHTSAPRLMHGFGQWGSIPQLRYNQNLQVAVLLKINDTYFVLSTTSFALCAMIGAMLSLSK